MRSQFVDLKTKAVVVAVILPMPSPEQGVAMLSSVLRSERAAEVNVAIIRAFVRLRQMLATNEELARKVADHDEKIETLFHYVEQLLRLLSRRRTESDSDEKTADLSAASLTADEERTGQNL